MSSTVNKLMSDFLNGLDQTQFYNEIVADGLITTTLISVVISAVNVDITFVSALSGAELTELNTLISNHIPSQCGYPAFQPSPNFSTQLNTNEYQIHSSTGSSIFSINQSSLHATVPVQCYKLTPSQIPAITDINKSLLYVDSTTGLLTQVEFGGASGPIPSSASNTGVGAGIFSGKTGSVLYFKSITGTNPWTQVVSGPSSVNLTVPHTSTTATGVIRMATQSEVNTGVATDLAISPSTLANFPQMISNSQVTSTTIFTSMSTTDVVISGMTITPGAGTYLVLFSCVISVDNDTSSSFVTLYNNGNAVQHTERKIDGNQFVTVALQSVTTVGAGQAIDVRARVITDNRTLTIPGPRTFTLIRLS